MRFGVFYELQLPKPWNRGSVRVVLLGLLSLLQVMGPGRADAQEQWTEFRPPDRTFVAHFPGAPTVSLEKKLGPTGYTQTAYIVDLGDRAFEIMMREYPPGTIPRQPDAAYFLKRVEEFAAGSETKARAPTTRTVSGRPGMEAVTDDAGKNIHYLLDVVAAGDRLYAIVSGGPQGHEQSADALRFRDSFRLTSE